MIIVPPPSSFSFSTVSPFPSMSAGRPRRRRKSRRRSARCDGRARSPSNSQRRNLPHTIVASPHPKPCLPSSRSSRVSQTKYLFLQTATFLVGKSVSRAEDETNRTRVRKVSHLSHCLTELNETVDTLIIRTDFLSKNLNSLVFRSAGGDTATAASASVRRRLVSHLTLSIRIFASGKKLH